MKKHTLFILLLFYSSLSFSQLSGYLSKLIKEPVEKKQKVLARYDLTNEQEDLITENIRKIKIKNEENKFKYAVEIIDPSNYLLKLGQYKGDLESMLINGQEKVRKDEADYIFTYVIKTAKIERGEVKPTGSYSTTEGYSYYAKGDFKFKACQYIYDNKKKEKRPCRGIGDYGEEVIVEKIRTSQYYNIAEAENEWKSNETLEKAGIALKRAIRNHFFKNTSQYKLIIPRKKQTTKGFNTYLFLFKQKGNRKHLKKASDGFANEIHDIIEKHYLRNNDEDKCGDIKTIEDARNCFKSLKKELDKELIKVSEGMNFWKNELVNKYTRKGKKSTIRSVMAGNLLTASYLLKNEKNILFSLKILEEEKEKNTLYLDAKKEIPNFIKKEYYMVPNYYMMIYGEKDNLVEGADYKIKSNF